MTISEDEDESLAQFLETEVLSNQRDKEDMVDLGRNCPVEFKEYYVQMQAAKRSQAPLPSQGIKKEIGALQLEVCQGRCIEEVYDALAERLVPTAAAMSNPNLKTRSAVINIFKMVDLAGKDGIVSEFAPGVFCQQISKMRIALPRLGPGSVYMR
ncbi:hypothetical protein ABKV19_005155 [Rosa sericea]